MRLLRRLAYLLRFRSEQADLREELRLHRDLLATEMQRRGMKPADANIAAQRTMGNETFMREEARGVWIAPRVEAFWKDWRYAWRGLRRSPVFALVAILSLGLGIGANTAIFGIIHTVLLARVPVPAAQELVQLRRDLGPKGVDEGLTTAEAAALSAGPLPLALFASTFISTDIGGAASNASLDAVDGNYFALLGVSVQRGRLPSRDETTSAAPVAVVTDRFWRGRMNHDSSAIGRIISIDRHPFTVIGILQPGFAGLRFPSTTEIVVPFGAATSLNIIRKDDPRRPQLAIARRQPHTSLEQANLALNAIWSRCCANGELAAVSRTPPPHSQLSLADISRGIPNVKLDLRGQYSRILLALMAGVAILLLAACANVANLLVARSASRTGELAVRLALGASRPRLVAQLLIESIQLSLFGGLLGLLIARWGTSVLLRAKIGSLSGVVTTEVGSSVLAFTAIVSAASGIVFGVVPALRVMRTDLITPLKQSGRRSAGGRRGWIDRGLVAVQMSLALLLVSGATLLVQTLRNLQQADLEFEPSHVLAVTIDTRHTPYERPGMTVQMANDILQRVRGVPGVQSAAFGSSAPVYGGRSVSDNVTVRDAQPVGGSDRDQTWFVGVTPDYFASMGIAIRDGRDVARPIPRFVSADTRDVVVNERFVKKYFPDRNPIGQLFYDSDEGDPSATPNRVVGVVGSAKFFDIRAPAEPMYFVPLNDGAFPLLVLVVRTSASASTVADGMRRAITAVAPGIGQGDPVFVSAAVDDALVRERISAALATLFGAIALSLAAVGLYGVMLYQVAERTTEIGIRVALGARPTMVMWLVLKQSLVVAGIGLAAGLPLAVLAGRAVQSQLYGVAPYDIGSLIAAATLLLIVTMVASLVPARKAIGVDPITALRS